MTTRRRNRSHGPASSRGRQWDGIVRFRHGGGVEDELQEWVP